jgi:hypothetical protein
MIISPLLALLVFRRADKAKAGKIRHDTIGIEDKESESRSLSSEEEPEA